MVRRLLLPVLALASVLGVAACDDAGTAPTSYVQVVPGGAWVAVAEPHGMARADTWLPWLAADGPAAAQVRQLREAAARARGAGRIQESLALEDDALRLAAGSLARVPDPVRVLVTLTALDTWNERARERLRTGRYPELDAAARGVAAEAAAARQALAVGDTSVAVLHVARGTVLAREQSALGVGVRMLAAIDGRLGPPTARESASVKRARRLLAGAREGLATGDHVRALRRAVYAMQLLEEEGISVPAPGRAIDSVPRTR